MVMQAQTPQHHYQEAERLARVAESVGTDPSIQQTAALAAVAHAVLALAPRRARRGKRVPERPGPGRHAGGSLEQRWLFGGDDQDGASS
ncbi:MAG TPA: hypothetical protein VGL39_23250 [Jatrophihabitantaceae bacterium]|jgi:hypothetical protein